MKAMKMILALSKNQVEISQLSPGTLAFLLHSLHHSILYSIGLHFQYVLLFMVLDHNGRRGAVVGYPSYRVSDPHVRVPLVLTAVDLEVVRWELVLEVDLVS